MNREMTIVQISVACLFLMVTSTGFSQSDGWRGIVPLHSTCEDAKHLLGISKCETNSYDLEDARVFIWFSKKPCVDGWNVPPGTVTSIEVYPKNKVRLADLNVDEKRFKKVVSRNQYDADQYIDEEKGIIIAAYPNGDVVSISYTPTPKDNYLRYPNSLADQPTAGGDPPQYSQVRRIRRPSHQRRTSATE